MAGSVTIAATIAGLERALAMRGVAVVADGAALLTDDPARIAESRPVILIVNAPGDVAAALDAGAADAVVAGSPVDEVAARIAARIRLSAPPLGIGELIIDRVTRRVTRAGRRLALMPREYALLLHLAQHVGNVVSRAALLEAVWGLRFDPGTNVVAVHVSRLRAKLDRGFDAPMLRTEKGVGYRLAVA